MGSFYVNICIRREQREVYDWLSQIEGLRGFVGPTVEGWTVVVTEYTETQDPKAIAAMLTGASKGTAAISFLNHDSDMLHVWLYFDGSLAGEFNSAPWIFMEDPNEEDIQPTMSGVGAFASLADGVAADDVMSSLNIDGDYVDPLQYHEALVVLLGLPKYGVGAGYTYVSRGEFSQVDWLSIGGA